MFNNVSRKSCRLGNDVEKEKVEPNKPQIAI